jgi:hypothetical protein
MTWIMGKGNLGLRHIHATRLSHRLGAMVLTLGPGLA